MTGSIPSTPDFVKSDATEFRVAINLHFADKVAKDAPKKVWNAFNDSFAHKQLTRDELAAHIQQGRAISAICRGNRETANFIERVDLGLDFDTEDARSTLDALQAHPFVADHGALLHTTSRHTDTAPRARVIFLFDKPITDLAQYGAYAQALNWYFGTSDAQCHDPVRVWFGAIGCQLRKLGNVLPCAVMDELVAQWKAAQPAQAEPHAPISVDAHELLDQALRDGAPGHRNNTGFWLACSLRDAGYSVDQARETLLVYQQAVERIGNHPYLVREATDSLASAYSHKPKVDVTIDAIEQAVVSGAIRVSANMQKTLFGILTIARKTGKTKDLALSLRSVEQACFGFVGKSTIANHLPAFVEAGILQLDRKSNRRSGSRYTILSAIVGHSQQEAPPTALSVQLLRIESYHALQAEPLCAIRAQIHPDMARDNDELHQSFGASAQRILAVLQSLPDGVDSLEALQELTRLSANTVSKKVSYLAAHQIVETAREGNRCTVKLHKYSRENIDTLTPALTSFGADLLRAERAAKQQIAHHEHMARFTANPDEKALSEATIERAEHMVEFLAPHKAEAYSRRQQWTQDNGLDPKAAPPLSLHPRSNPKRTIKLCLGSEQTKSHLPPGNNKTKLEALRNMKRRLTPNEIVRHHPETERIQLGNIHDDNFGKPISKEGNK